MSGGAQGERLLSAQFREPEDWTRPGARRSVCPRVAAVGKSGLDGIYSLPESLLPNFLFHSVATRPGTRLCVHINLVYCNCHH